MPRRFQQTAMIGWLLLLAGCTQRTVTDDGVVVGYSPIFFWICVACGVVGIPIGYFVRKHSLKIGWAILFVGVAGPVLGIPTYFMERFEITKEGVNRQTGIFGIQKPSFLFDNIQSVVVEKTLRKQSRGLDYLECIFWLTKKSDGGVDKVIFSDRVSEVATEDVISAFKKRNIPLQIVER